MPVTTRNTSPLALTVWKIEVVSDIEEKGGNDKWKIGRVTTLFLGLHLAFLIHPGLFHIKILWVDDIGVHFSFCFVQNLVKLDPVSTYFYRSLKIFLRHWKIPKWHQGKKQNSQRGVRGERFLGCGFHFDFFFSLKIAGGAPICNVFKSRPPHLPPKGQVGWSFLAPKNAKILVDPNKGVNKGFFLLHASTMWMGAFGVRCSLCLVYKTL